MRKITHQFLRGTIYYWRRKMQRFSTEFMDMQIRACIPGRKHRKESLKYEKRRYKMRNRIEIMFGRLKD